MTTTTVPVLFTAGAVKAIQKLLKEDSSASSKAFE